MKLLSKDTLRALIKQRGLSYSDIGDMCGCHRTMISQLVNGSRTSCKPELAEKIAALLGVPREVLFVAKTSAVNGSLDAPRTSNSKSQRQAKVA